MEDRCFVDPVFLFSPARESEKIWSEWLSVLPQRRATVLTSPVNTNYTLAMLKGLTRKHFYFYSYSTSFSSTLTYKPQRAVHYQSYSSYLGWSVTHRDMCQHLQNVEVCFMHILWNETQQCVMRYLQLLLRLAFSRILVYVCFYGFNDISVKAFQTIISMCYQYF